MASNYDDFLFQKNSKYYINNSPGHFWAISNNEEELILGLSDFFQKRIGEIKSFTIKDKVGKKISKGKTLGLVKAKNYSAVLKYPLSGELIAVNNNVSLKPKLINESPYKNGWIIKLKLDSTINEETSSEDWVDLSNSSEITKFKAFIELELKNNALSADDCCPDFLGGSGVVRRRKK